MVVKPLSLLKNNSKKYSYLASEKNSGHGVFLKAVHSMVEIVIFIEMDGANKKIWADSCGLLHQE
jgi:hypothetical protein